MAKKKNVVGDMSALPGMCKDLFRQICDGSITLDHFQGFLEHRNPFSENIKKETIAQAEAPTILVANELPDLDWQKAYQALTVTPQEYQAGIGKLDLPNLPGFWVLPMLPILRKEGKQEVRLLTCNRIKQALQAAGSGFWSVKTDMDGNLDPEKEARCPYRDGAYARKFARSIEAEEVRNNCAVNDLEESFEGIGLLERLFLELAYFLTTGKHLDIEHWTISSGSRWLDGYVPDVYWSGSHSKVRVDWHNPSDRNDQLRLRSADSLPAQPRESAAELAIT